MEAQTPEMQRPRAVTVLAIVAGIGGVLGVLSGMWLLTVTPGGGKWGLPVTLAVLVLSAAELAFAYSFWTQTFWALRPVVRAIGFVVAIALILLGIYVSFSIRTGVAAGGGM
jgi:hypothetical protein